MRRLFLALIFLVGVFTLQAVQSTGRTELAVKIVSFQSAQGYLPILSGPPESVSMESGFVTVDPGKSGSLHSTKLYEETIVVLRGRGSIEVKGSGSRAFEAGSAVYVPPQKEHQITNIGHEPLQYVYVASKALREPEPKN